MNNQQNKPMKTTILFPILLGLMAGATIKDTFAQLPGSELWEFSAGLNPSTTPAIGQDGTIYFPASSFSPIHGSKFFALTPAGAQKWELDVPGTIPGSPAIGSDGTV